MEITEEMRRAVLGAECDKLGHVPDISQAISNNPSEVGENTIRIRAEDADSIPHISCKRCRKVWLIVEDPGDDYDTAEAALNERLLPKFRRQLRKQRRQAAQDARDAAAAQ